MVDYNKEKEQQKDKEEVYIPDLAEMWKEMYFKAEGMWADIFKEIVSSKTFTGNLTNTMDQYLNQEKVNRQIIDKYFEMSPVPSKKDIARIAELIISTEEKIDQMEFQCTRDLNIVSQNLIKIVDFQSSIKQEVSAVKEEMEVIRKKLEDIDEQLKQTKKTKSSKKEKPVVKEGSPALTGRGPDYD